MNTDDQDDAAWIARALDLEGERTDGADETTTSEYRAVLANLSDEVAPPPELEDRMVAAALARRPASATAISGAPTRRRARARYAAFAAATAVAAGIAISVLVVNGSPASKPSGRVEPIAISRADAAAVATQPGARTGTLSNGIGQVVLAADGTGYLYDLTPAGPIVLSVETDKSARLGEATPRAGIVGFTVDHPGLVRAVRVTSVEGTELGRAVLTTS